MQVLGVFGITGTGNMTESIVYNEDCMVGMARYPDKYFDLAIVDPPYGIKAVQRIYKNRANYQNPKCLAKGITVKKASHKIKEWDNDRPTCEYFNELQRISKNQIIWGGNYFADLIPVSRCWIFWDKDVYGDFSKGELAWTSFDGPINKVMYMWDGMRQGKGIGSTEPKGGNFKQGNKTNLETRIHPTQKPVVLYEWILKNYAKPGYKIIDTHVGSGSSRIAAFNAGLDYIGFEIDVDYWKAQEQRFDIHKQQLTIFEPAFFCPTT